MFYAAVGQEHEGWGPRLGFTGVLDVHGPPPAWNRDLGSCVDFCTWGFHRLVRGPYANIPQKLRILAKPILTFPPPKTPLFIMALLRHNCQAMNHTACV